jgi:hypothetical protein
VVADRIAHRYRRTGDRRLVRDEVPAERAGLGAAEPVHEHARGREVAPVAVHVAPDRGLPEELDEAHAGERFGPREGVQEVAEQGRDRGVERDLFGREPVRQPGHALLPHREVMERDATQQRRPDLVAARVDGAGEEERQPVLGGDREPLQVRAHEVEHVAVGLDHALGAARGARGVEDPDGSIRRHRHARVGLGRAPGADVEVQHRVAATRQAARQRERLPVGQDGGSPGILQDLARPGAGQRRVDGHVGLAGLEGPQHRRHHGHAALEEEHQGLGCGAALGEDGMRDAVGEAVQVAVRQPVLPGGDGQAFGLGGGHRLEGLGDRGVFRRPASGRPGGLGGQSHRATHVV